MYDMGEGRKGEGRYYGALVKVKREDRRRRCGEEPRSKQTLHTCSSGSRPFSVDSLICRLCSSVHLSRRARSPAASASFCRRSSPTWRSCNSWARAPWRLSTRFMSSASASHLSDSDCLSARSLSTKLKWRAIVAIQTVMVVARRSLP